VERLLADDFLFFVARALRPAELFFLPNAVPEKTREIRTNRIKTNRRDLGEWKCRVIRPKYLSFEGMHSPHGE
jgi:hypothetical protein